MPKNKIDSIFVDIDTTLVDPIPGDFHDERNLDQILAEAIAMKTGAPTDRGMCQIEEGYLSVGDMVGRKWPFGVMEGLGLSLQELWDILVEYTSYRIFFHEDAKVFLKGMRKIKGVKVYTATTNPHYIILAKLAVGGLADLSGSPYFDLCAGGEEIYPGGKACPEFFKALLAISRSDPENTLMVGDSPVYDLTLANAAGIRNVVLARRGQNQEVIDDSDGAIYVKSLETVLSMLAK